MVITAIVIGLYFLNLDFVNKLALQLEDTKFGIRDSLGLVPTANENVVIVAIDEKSVKSLGRYPWDRRVHADLFARLDQASIVGLDIIFGERTTQENDQYLADVISQNENIVCGYLFRNEAVVQTSVEALDLLRHNDSDYLNIEFLDEVVGLGNYKYADINIPEISSSCLTSAFFTNQPDPDGLYRRYPLGYIHQGFVFPPLAVQLVRFYQNKQAAIVLDKDGVKSFRLGEVDLSDENYFKFNFYTLDQDIFISAVDVYDGTVPPDFFKDKVVLVGVTEMGLYDMRPTPVNPVTPGVWLHYTALSNLLNNEILVGSRTLDVSLILFGLLLVFAISFHRILWQRVALYIAVLMLLSVVANGALIAVNIWLREFFAFAGVILLMIVLEIFAFVRTELRAGEVKKAFTSYVSPEVVGEILKDPDKLELGGVEREITVLFSDIRGFTSLSEKVTPTQLVQMLTQIHDPMTNVVLNNKGMLDKYIGDAMMALFNAPLDVANHADKAVHSALAMIETLHEVNGRFRAQGYPEVDVGIGVNTGKCIVGNMGSKVRFEYTAIGDAVNLASRLEGLCKTYKCRVVISDATREQLSDGVLVRQLDRVRVKGKNIPVHIFEAMKTTEDNKQIKQRFEQGLEKYFSQEFSQAMAIFEDLADNMGDKPSEIFIARCKDFIANPPEQDWDGVYSHKTK
ncbi:MAG: adenylate/guanylate cyclase domain-containing protein [Proteobacteria bacterium]|nr:adenylate/guanylate cyclase domain-containing protein [Pseudomonadota bacterium]MBU1711388.1 adenylate/guanylate cyclase domain-containing protein [Pseudomonadota bacterium]